MSETNEALQQDSISRQETIAIRRRLQARFAAVPLAYSVDGKTFGYEAPLDFPIPTGSYVQMTTSDDQIYLGQIISKTISTRQGPEIAVDVGQRMDMDFEGATVSQVLVQPTIRYLEGGGVMLGKAVPDGLAPPQPSDIFQDAALEVAPGSLINEYLASTAGAVSLEIGRAMYGDASSIAALRASGFNRHTFLCGQSGSGKTYSLGVVLERLLLRTSLRVLVIDPNSDFVRLPRLREEVGESFDASDIERFRALSSDMRIMRPLPQDGQARLAIQFGDLTRNEQAVVLQLDPLEDREEYSGFWRIVDHLARENIELSDVLDAAMRDPAAESRQISLRVRNLGISDWSVWCRSGEASFIDQLDDEWRAMILDIGTFGLPAEKEIATLALFSQLWRRRTRREPLLIVIDEAHNICPAEPENALQELLTQYVIRIAGEGRKFGLYILLSSQRPQKIHPNVLSQCDNLLLMRMNSSADLAHLAEVFSFVPNDLLDEASHFRQGESLVAGRVVSNPTFVRFGARMTEEGGSDVPTSWAKPVSSGT